MYLLGYLEHSIRSPLFYMSKPRCKHCGSLISSSSRKSEFCCAGCEHVYQLICSEGLGTYYEMRSGVGRPVGDESTPSKDLAWAADLQAKVELAHKKCELDLRLDGLNCLGCTWLVEHLFNRMDGGRSIRVGLEEHRMNLCWLPGQFDLPSFLKTLADFGFHALPYRAGVTARWSPLTWRLMLCGLFTMNAGLLSFAAVAIDNPAYDGLIDLLRWLFVLLSILVGGSHFAVPVLRSLQAGVIHYDTLIAFGLLLLPLAWTQDNMIAMDGQIGLWKLPMLVFFLVMSRWLHVRVRLPADDLSGGATGMSARRIIRWMGMYVYVVLVVVLFVSVWSLLTRSAVGLDRVAAAFFVGALYPLARVTNLKPSCCVCAFGIAMNFCGVLLALVGMLDVFGALLWMLAVGVIWLGALGQFFGDRRVGC